MEAGSDRPVPRGPPSRGSSASSPPPVIATSPPRVPTSPRDPVAPASPRTRRIRANTLDMHQPPPFVATHHDALYDSIHLYTVRSRRGGLRERSRLNKTISKLARNELTKRTSVSLKAAIRPSREGHIFDYFCVVGYPPAVKVELKATSEQRRQEPVILYQYPQDNMLNEQVVHFCFPSGVTPTVVPRRRTADKSATTLELANCSMKELKDSERSFLFLMTGTGALFYGICVSQNELLSSLEKPSFFTQPAYNPSSPLTNAELRFDISAPRVYCLLSRFPFFKLHFNVLYSLLETERMMQREALERAQKQSGALIGKATTNTSSTHEVEEENKDEEKEKKTWNWRWRWGKDKEKNDGNGSSSKEAKSPLPKMSRTSSASSFNAWTVKKTIKDEHNLSPRGARSSDPSKDEGIPPSPLSGPADHREKSDADASKLNATALVSPPRTRTRSNTKGESENPLRAHKRTHSRVRSLFALGGNKIERDPAEEEDNESDKEVSVGEVPTATTTESPFPGIRLHQQQEAAASDSPFPGIRLRICTEDDRSGLSDSSKTITTTDSETASPANNDSSNGASAVGDTASSTKEKNRVLELLEAYYNANIRTTLGSFAINLPTAQRQDKFICPEGDEEKLIMECCAPTMLRLVPLPNVIVLLRALLQEYKVVLLCKNLGVLSFIAMALLPLLRPFEWQGPFIPLVPKNLEECVESPVPCVLGMPTTTEDDLIPLVDDCLIVNIETEQVVLPERQLSPLPHEEELYAQLSVYHNKIYQPSGSESRNRCFHRPGKSTDEEQAITAGFLNVVRSYMEKLVQEIVNVAHIHCISESSPCPSLPNVPLALMPTVSAPALPTFSLASSASYSAIHNDYDDEYGASTNLNRQLLDSPFHRSGAAPGSVSSPSSSSTTPRDGQPYQSFSLAMPAIRQLDDSDDESESVDAKRPKDPKRRILDDHQQWTRTHSDNVEVSSSMDEAKSDKKKKKGGRKAIAGALTQTLPHNRELQDIKTLVEFDRVPSSGSMQPHEVKQDKQPSKDSQDDVEANASRGHVRPTRTLSLSASLIPEFVPSPSTSPESAGSEFGTVQKTVSDSSTNASTSTAKSVVVPPLPIRVRGPLSTSDQTTSSLPGSSSPSASPEQRRRVDSVSTETTGSDSKSPMLILSLRPSIPPLESHMPQLVASTFDWTDMGELKTLVSLFPVTQQRFMSNFLFTQHFTVFTERLNAIYGRGQHNNNVLTPRSAARFLEQLKKMIEQEEAQAMMARSLLQIYSMLEQQKEVVGGMIEDEHHSTSPQRPIPSSDAANRNKTLLGLPLSGHDFGKKRDSGKGGSAVGVRGEAATPVASPSPMSKRPGHRRQGSVGGQEILKVKPEEEIEQGEEGKEQKNMEQIMKLSAERLRVLTRSKDIIKALFTSDSPSASLNSSPQIAAAALSLGASVEGRSAKTPIPSGPVTGLSTNLTSPRSQAIKRAEPPINIIVSESPSMGNDKEEGTAAAAQTRGNKKIRGGRRRTVTDRISDLREDEEA